MNPKRLLFTLFLLYWAGVYGVTFFSENYKEKIKNSSYRFFMPTGYNMFSPVTQTTFNVKFEFFEREAKIGEINSWDYLNENGKFPIERKEVFLKKMVYFYRVPDLDYAFLKNDYDLKYRNKKEDLDSIYAQDIYLKNLISKIKKSSELFIKEDADLERADSVFISIKRTPIILPFHPEYKENYTFHVGDTVFFSTYYLPQSFTK